MTRSATLAPHRVIAGADDFLRSAQLPTYSEVVSALRVAYYDSLVRHHYGAALSEPVAERCAALLNRIPREDA